MRDLLKDWQRWTTAERVAVVLIAMLLLIGGPTAFLVNTHLTTPEHTGSGSGNAS
jgi:hypothetical protein